MKLTVHERTRLIARMQNAMQERSLTTVAVAAGTGVHQGQVSRILRGEFSRATGNALAVCNFLGFDLESSMAPNDRIGDRAETLRSQAEAPPNGGTRFNLAYDHIKQRLLDGDFRPGSRLPVAEFAKVLKISKYPVMSALQQLASEELVQIIPQVGCLATRHSAQEISDFFRFFAQAESLIAELAASRGSEVEMRQLKVLSAEIGALSKEPDAHLRAVGYRRRNRVFHAHIEAMARSPSLERLIGSLRDRSDYYIATHGGYEPFARRLRTAHREHEAVVFAILKRDPDGAREAMREHILQSIVALDD